MHKHKHNDIFGIIHFGWNSNSQSPFRICVAAECRLHWGESLNRTEWDSTIPLRGSDHRHCDCISISQHFIQNYLSMLFYIFIYAHYAFIQYNNIEIPCVWSVCIVSVHGSYLLPMIKRKCWKQYEFKQNYVCNVCVGGKIGMKKEKKWATVRRIRWRKGNSHVICTS